MFDYFEIFLVFFVFLLLVFLFFPFIPGDEIKVDEFFLFFDKVSLINDNKTFEFSFASIKLSKKEYSYFKISRSFCGVPYTSNLYLCYEDYKKLFGDLNESKT